MNIFNLTFELACRGRYSCYSSRVGCRCVAENSTSRFGGMYSIANLHHHILTCQQRKPRQNFRNLKDLKPRTLISMILLGKILIRSYLISITSWPKWSRIRRNPEQRVFLPVSASVRNGRNLPPRPFPVVGE